MNFLTATGRFTRQVPAFLTQVRKVSSVMPSNFRSRRSLPGKIVVALVGIASAHQAVAVDLAPAERLGVRQTVEVTLELGGELKVESTETNPNPQPTPVEVVAQLTYDEVRLPADGIKSARYYQRASATTKVGGRTKQPTLRDSHRLTLATLDTGKRQLSAVAGPLNRQEYDLLNLWADSLILDLLLPIHEVSLGDTWDADSATMQMLTDLDHVEVCEVNSELIESSEKFARCRLFGTVEGVVAGTKTKLELDGLYLVDLSRHQIVQLNMAIREQRDIGPATPGLEAVTKLKVKRRDATDDSPITPELVSQVMKSPTDSEVELRNDRLGFSTLCDTKWYVTGQVGDYMALRRVEPSGLVTHGNLSGLPPRSLDSASALDDFRRDVLKSLGKSATGVASESQWTNRHGCRVMEVTVVGQINGLEVEWHCYQVAPPSEQEHLHRLAITFTVEKTQLELLDKMDHQFIDQLQLTPTNVQQAAEHRRQR